MIADEAALTPHETGRRVKAAVIRLGAAFGHEAAFGDAGRQLGLDQRSFYFGARAGVLGPVDAEVVTAVCGLFSPSLVHPAWESVPAAASPAELAAEDVRLCVAWARRHLGQLPGIDHLAGLISRVVAAADASGRPLFAAWRALPDPAEGPPADQVGLGLLRLREHRGAGHLLAVAASGLTPLELILAGAGPAKAAANGWRPPYPLITRETAQRLAAADQCTDTLAGMPYGCLDCSERAELASLLRSAHQQTVG